MGVFLDALRSLKGSYIDPTSTPPSRDPEDWTEIPAKTSEDFPKQCIAVVQGGSLLLRNNFTREGFRVNILPRGKELREERIRTPEYRITSIDLNPGCTVFVCPDMGDENTATGNAQIFMADPKRATKWWKYFSHTISTKLDKIFQNSDEEWTIFRWFDNTDAKKALNKQCLIHYESLVY